jgi:ribonuclease VapC
MLDASALLSVLLAEPGEARVIAALPYARMHAVNVAEVVARLVRSGVPVPNAVQAVASFQFTVHEGLPGDVAVVVGALMGQHRTLDLSLGDWVCLATAARAGAVAMTADRAWQALDGKTLFGNKYQVEVIR